MRITVAHEPLCDNCEQQFELMFTNPEHRTAENREWYNGMFGCDECETPTGLPLVVMLPRQCTVCSQPSFAILPPKAYDMWRRGYPLSEAWPNSTPEGVTLLIEGTHPACKEEQLYGIGLDLLVWPSTLDNADSKN